MTPSSESPSQTPLATQEGSEPNLPYGKYPKSPRGRLVSYVLFSVVAAWGAISVLGSVAVDLYADPPQQVSPDDPFRDRSWCARRLASLQQELDARATFEAGAEVPDPDPVQRWREFVGAWQGRFNHAQQLCSSQSPALADAFNQLNTWHRGISSGIEQLLRTRHGLGREVSREARALLPQP